ncbi:hypothetical protein [Streptomyces sp. TRM49041]|uniref:hypothetical protein n=1 Tax=Streptomyces sp. TRM49041 TaxID=2603216 RepID=UPI0011EC034F|nr:hypothetical protein [Streptomyces sp. TRM49041]
MSKDSKDSKDQTPLLRRRGARLTAVASAAAVVVAGGTFWLSGGYEEWRGTDPLSRSCQGDLAAEPVRELLPDVELTSSSELRQDGWFCSAETRDGKAGLQIRIRNVGEPFGPDGAIDPGEHAVPLGGGWTGSFSYDATATAAPARALVLLDCGDAPGDGLLAAADGRLGRGGTFSSAEARANLVRALTDTALSYARRTGCDAQTADPLDKVPAPSTGGHQPLAKASGTCANVVDAATGRRWGAGAVVETPAEPAPVETCLLGSRLGTPLYTFTASYGPYGEAALSGPDAGLPAKDKADSPTGRYRMTARCPGADATAVYTIAPDDGLALDHASLRTALKSFATRSADRHACEPPA